MFINLAVNGSVDVFWHWDSAPKLLRGHRDVASAGLFLALGLLWWVLVTNASVSTHWQKLSLRERQRLIWSWEPNGMLRRGGPQGDDVWKDPASSVITDPLVWAPHPIVHRLHRIHFGFGSLVLAYSAAAASDSGWEIPGVSLFDLPTGIVLVALLASLSVLVTTGWNPRPAGLQLRRLTAWQPTIGLVLLIGAAALLAGFGVESGSGHWPHLHDTSSMLVALGLSTLVLISVTAGRFSAGGSTFAALFGLILGAGVTLAASKLTKSGSFEGGGMSWLSVGVLIWLLVVVVVAESVLIVRLLGGKRREMWDAIHETTGKLGALFWVMPAAASVLAFAVLWGRCNEVGENSLLATCFQSGELPRLPSWLGRVTFGLAVAAWMGLWIFSFLAKRWSLGVGTMVLAPLAFLWLRRFPFSVAGVQLSLKDLTAVASTLAVVLPSAFILRRMVAGLRGGVESRRGTGVIWDTIMFWPRWFHPLAPPSYGPKAIAALRDQIETVEPAHNTGPLVIAAHSQGSIISLVTLGLIGKTAWDGGTARLGNPAALRRLGFLTYGAPICHLYHAYFPSARFDALVGAVGVGLGVHPGSPNLSGRWANLHRPTDPIGGPVDAKIDVLVADPVEPVGEPAPKDSPVAAIGQQLRGTYKGFRKQAKPERVKRVYRLHSRYEPSVEYRAQRDRIASLLASPLSDGPT